MIVCQILDNEKIVMQICTECARKKGLSIEFNAVDSVPPVSSALFGDMEGMEADSDEETIRDLACESCGLTYSVFKKTGLFGCDRCHLAFEDQVKSLLKQIHGFVDHKQTEKSFATSVKSTPKKKLKKLQAELKHCVEMEEYEKAAELRDRISELQKKADAQ